MTDAERERQRPCRDVVKQRVLERRHALHHRFDEPRLRLIDGHDECRARLEPLAVHLDRLREIVDADPMAGQQLGERLCPSPVAIEPDHVALHVGGAGKIGRSGVEVALVTEQVLAHRHGRFERRERRGELVADRRGVVEPAVHGLGGEGAAGRLLEEDADAAVHVGVRRALAVVEVVERLLRVVERADAVERAGVVRRDLAGEVERAGGRVRVVAARDAGLEEERGVAAHLVEVGRELGPPAMPKGHPPLRLRVLHQQPVAVEVEEVVVRPAAGPRLVVLAVLPVERR